MSAMRATALTDSGKRFATFASRARSLSVKRTPRCVSRRSVAFFLGGAIVVVSKVALLFVSVQFVPKSLLGHRQAEPRIGRRQPIEGYKSPPSAAQVHRGGHPAARASMRATWVCPNGWPARESRPREVRARAMAR